MNITDQQTDISRKFLYNAIGSLSDQDFGNQVKSMSCAKHDFSKIASERFAWEDKRCFPLDSLENTVMSKVYFDAQREKLASRIADDISTRIDTYLNLYDVPESVFERVTVKTAASNFTPRYLVPDMQLCKVAGAESLEKAGKLFDRDHKKLPITQRVEFAHNFVKAAKELKYSGYPRSVAKYASELDSDLSNTQHMLNLRAAAARLKGNSGEEYSKMAAEIGKVNTKPESKDLTKLAETIHTLDCHNGFDSGKYINNMPCPYSVVFNKEAVEEDKKEDESKTMTKADVVARFGDEALETLEDEDGEIDRDKLKYFIAMQKETTDA